MLSFAVNGLSPEAKCLAANGSPDVPTAYPHVPSVRSAFDRVESKASGRADDDDYI